MKHPEQQDNEIYMGNIGISNFCESEWATKRIGIQCFDIYGEKFSSQDCRPWFIEIPEVGKQIEILKVDKSHNWNERIRILQEMVDKRSAL